jgi:hypothetical protein
MGNRMALPVLAPQGRGVARLVLAAAALPLVFAACDLGLYGGPLADAGATPTPDAPLSSSPGSSRPTDGRGPSTDAPAPPSGSAPDGAPAPDAGRPGSPGDADSYELRIKTAGKGSGIIADKEEKHLIWCDSECTITSGPSKCDSCVARYPAGTQVTLELRPRSPTVAMQWAGACAAGRECVVVMDKDRDVSVDLQIEGATHLDRIFPNPGSLVSNFVSPSKRFVLGPDLFTAGMACTGCVILNGKPFEHAGLYTARLGSDGAWETPQFFGDGWSPTMDSWRLGGVAITETGELLGAVFANEMPFGFRGAPGKPFLQVTFPPKMRSLSPLRNGFLGSSDAMPWTLFDATGKAVAPVAPGFSTALVVVGADKGGLFVSPSSPASVTTIAKIDGAGKKLWESQVSVDLRNRSDALLFDGVDGLVVTGVFDSAVSIGGTTIQTKNDSIFVARLSGTDGSVRWARAIEGTQTPFAAIAGTALYVGGNIHDQGGGARAGDATVRGTGFIARLDLNSGQPIWFEPTAHDVASVSATSTSVWVTSSSWLYRFLP